MDLHGLLFEVGPALKKIFELGFIPEEGDFYEFTSEHYEKYSREFGEPEEKMFMLLPQNPNYQTQGNEVEILSESQIAWFTRAKKIIERYCAQSKRKLKTTDEKLRFVARQLPDIFSKGTRYQPTRLKIVGK